MVTYCKSISVFKKKTCISPFSSDNMDRVRRSRLAPPGFSHMNAFGLGQPRPQQQTHHQSNCHFLLLLPLLQERAISSQYQL